MKRVLETRALPVLIEKRNDLLEEMEKLTQGAETETRALNVDEINRFNEIKTEISEIDKKLDAEKRDYLMTPGKNKGTNDTKELRVFNEGEKLEIESRANDVNLSMGQLVRAMSGVETQGDGIKYLRDMSSATGAVVIPKQLATQIIDKAGE